MGSKGGREEQGIRRRERVVCSIAIGGRRAGDWALVTAPTLSDSRKARLVLSLIFSHLHVDFFLHGLLSHRLTHLHYTCSKKSTRPTAIRAAALRISMILSLMTYSSLLARVSQRSLTTAPRQPLALLLRVVGVSPMPRRLGNMTIQLFPLKERVIPTQWHAKLNLNATRRTLSI